MPFNLNLYKTTKLEQWIINIYQDNFILNPDDMDLDAIADLFNCVIVYSARRSRVIFDDIDGGMIFLGANNCEKEQRLEFFHELSHPALHVGDQRRMKEAFADLQESQAAAFQLYASMPIFMIKNIEPKGTWHEYFLTLSDAFQVPYSFVEKRIDQIKRRIYREYQERNFKALIAPVKASYGYSEETLDLIAKLNRQTMKGGLIL